VLDIACGSRTIKTFIWERANMGILLKWGNWFVAKLLEVLFNTSYLSQMTILIVAMRFGLERWLVRLLR